MTKLIIIPIIILTSCTSTTINVYYPESMAEGTYIHGPAIQDTSSSTNKAHEFKDMLDIPLKGGD